MEVYNIKFAQYPIYRQLKSRRSNNIIDLTKEMQKQEKGILKRMENAIDIFGNRVTPNLDLEELEKVLNPKQMEMVLLDDISYIDDVIEALLRMRYIEQMTIGTSSSSYFICNPPHTDIFIKPYLRENSDIIYVKELVVVSKQLVDSIYKYECFHC